MLDDSFETRNFPPDSTKTNPLNPLKQLNQPKTRPNQALSSTKTAKLTSNHLWPRLGCDLLPRLALTAPVGLLLLPLLACLLLAGSLGWTTPVSPSHSSSLTLPSPSFLSISLGPFPLAFFISFCCFFFMFLSFLSVPPFPSQNPHQPPLFPF